MNPIVTSRSLVYRDCSSSLVRALLTRGLLPVDVLSSFSENIYDAFESSEVSSYERAARLLPVDVLSSFSENIYDAFESSEVSSYERAAYERAARLYSETARKTTNQKTNTFVVIASLCVTSIPAMISTLF
jgi:hypothetical protein